MTDAAALDDPLCPACGYSLRGLPTDGVCPECSAAYTPQSVLRYSVPPSPWRMTLRIGWPLFAFTAFLALLLLGLNTNADGSICTLFALMGGCTFAMAITVPVQAVVLTRRHLHPARRSRSTTVNLWRLSPAAFLVALVSVLVVAGAVVGFGACLVALNGIH
jgi:hypothetical protein